MLGQLSLQRLDQRVLMGLLGEVELSYLAALEHCYCQGRALQHVHSHITESEAKVMRWADGRQHMPVVHL